MIAKQDLAQQLRWNQWGTRSLTYDAEIMKGEGQPTPYSVAVTMAVGKTRSQVRAPGSFVARAMTSATISAPERIETPSGVALFVGWHRTVGSEQPQFAFTLTEDTNLTARYRIVESE